MRITKRLFLLLAASLLLASCSSDKTTGDGSTEIHLSIADARAGWVENEIRLAFKG